MPYENVSTAVDQLLAIFDQNDLNVTTSRREIGALFSFIPAGLGAKYLQSFFPAAYSYIGIPLSMAAIWLVSYKLSKATAISVLYDKLPEPFMALRGHLISVNASSKLLNKFNEFINDNEEMWIGGDLKNRFVQHLYDTCDVENIRSLVKLGLDKKALGDVQSKIQRELKEQENADAEEVGVKGSKALTWLAAKSVVKNKININDSENRTEDVLRVIEKARKWTN